MYREMRTELSDCALPVSRLGGETRRRKWQERWVLRYMITTYTASTRLFDGRLSVLCAKMFLLLTLLPSALLILVAASVFFSDSCKISLTSVSQSRHTELLSQSSDTNNKSRSTNQLDGLCFGISRSGV